MKFKVRALKGDVFETLDIDAPDLATATRQVRDLGMTVVSAVGQGATGKKSGRSRKSFDLTLFSQELQELLVAGLGVVEAIDTLSLRRGDEETARVMSALLTKMREGFTFSVALESMPEAFPPLYVGLIRASERTSDLQAAMERYLDYRGRFEALKARITGALLYPSVLIGVAGLVMVLLGGWVIPKFSIVFQASGRELPLLSRYLLDWGMLVNHHRATIGITALAIVCSAAWGIWYAVKSGKIENLIALAPGLSERVHIFRVSRMYLAFGTLLNGGMPAIQALKLVEGVVPPIMVAGLRAVEGDLRRGEAITKALERQNLTTPVALRLLQVGEGAGRLGEMFVRAARYHDNEFSRWIDRFTKLFEPILMASIGTIIGTVVVLLYMPIFELTSGFQ